MSEAPSHFAAYTREAIDRLLKTSAFLYVVRGTAGDRMLPKPGRLRAGLGLSFNPSLLLPYLPSVRFPQRESPPSLWSKPTEFFIWLRASGSETLRHLSRIPSRAHSAACSGTGVSNGPKSRPTCARTRSGAVAGRSLYSHTPTRSCAGRCASRESRTTWNR